MIYLEIFGYIGTALVIASMLMTKLSMLRILNISGSVISAIYSYLCDAMPVVLLNVALIMINCAQLVRENRRKKQFSVSRIEQDCDGLNEFIEAHSEDIERRFPEYRFNIGDESVIYMVYSGSEPIGIFVGREEDGGLRVSFGYSVPGYKYSEVVLRFMTELKENGYTSPGSEILMPFRRSI